MEVEDGDEHTVLLGGEEILHEVIREQLGRKARNRSLQRVLAVLECLESGIEGIQQTLMVQHTAESWIM